MVPSGFSLRAHHKFTQSFNGLFKSVKGVMIRSSLLDDLINVFDSYSTSLYSNDQGVYTNKGRVNPASKTTVGALIGIPENNSFRKMFGHI